jgi:CDP-diglyceride synthetase
MGLENLFAQWEAAGIFAYAFPFLLIFALVFGLLMKINIFGTKDNPNKAVNAIISLAVALMALQFNIVSEFFSSIFPRFGVALAIILVILIIFGFFTDLGNKNMKLILSGVILIALIAVLWVPLSELGFKINLSFFKENFAVIIFLILIVGLIVWAMAGGKDKTSGQKAKPLDSQPSV